MTKKAEIKILRNPLTEAADSDYVVCPRQGIDVAREDVRDDALNAKCCKCDAVVWVSPTSPSNVPRICYKCVDELIDQDEDDPVFSMTENMAANLGLLPNKRKS